MNPVCVTCMLELKPYKIGITVVEYNKAGPYRIWQADISRCPECEVAIITGYANQPLAEHYHPNFRKELTLARSNRDRTFEIHGITP